MCTPLYVSYHDTQNYDRAFLKAFDLGAFKLLFGNTPSLRPVMTLNIRCTYTAHRVSSALSFICSLSRACNPENLSHLSRRHPLLYSICSLPGGLVSIPERFKAAVALHREATHGEAWRLSLPWYISVICKNNNHQTPALPPGMAHLDGLRDQ